MGKRILEYVLRSVDALTGSLANIALVAMLALTAWVTFCVAMRFIFKNPIVVSIEMGLIIAMFIFFLPLAIVLKNQVHPRVSLLTNKMSQRWQNLVQLFNLLVTAGLGSLYAFLFGQEMLQELFIYKTRCETMPYLLIGYARVPMVIGMGTFVLLAIAYFGLTLRNLIRGRPAQGNPDLKVGS
jgi:TRAP-type C4-dicarboxylate transport system permease small subunit